MGNLIKDFWTYTYNNQNYFGIGEVVLGEDLRQDRADKKFETHIDKALAYVMNKKVVSHMSIQKYATWLKDRAGREADEQKYYPFTVEFDADEVKNTYSDAVYEAVVYIAHLIGELQIHERDICIMINNSRSIYILVNPKSFGLKPSKLLHNIYFEMYKEINKEFSFKFVDESIVRDTYKLMKTPNSYYKDGYFVQISYEELCNLMLDSSLKSSLTSSQRSLDVEIPGQLSFAMAKLYQECKDKVSNKKLQDQLDLNSSCSKKCSKGCKCVEYFRNAIIEKGMRNYALVSVAINLKNNGYTPEQVLQELIGLKEAWQMNDETERDIRSKVNTIFRKNYNFSCEYVRNVFEDVEGLCGSCSWNNDISEDNKEIKVNGAVINELWENNASTRHYLLYIQLLSRNFLNKWIDTKEENLNDRTIRELCNLSSKFERQKAKGKTFITYRADFKGYKLPGEFLDTAQDLGDYLKHYLKLLVKGYKTFNKYALIRISKNRIMAEMGYKDISSVYKFVNKLQELGLIICKKNNVSCLYYQTYKVISIDEYKASNEAEKALEAKNEQKEYKYNYTAVNGQQLSFEGLNIGYRIKIANKKSQRGSPG